MQKLNIGCGRVIEEGFINLDLTTDYGADVAFDLESCVNDTDFLPFDDNSIDEIHAYHVIEHLDYILPVMEELHRIATPDCKLLVKVPYGNSEEAFADPTHVRNMFPSSFGYFSQPYYWKADYGYRGDWEVDELLVTIEEEKMNHLKSMGADIEFAFNHFNNVFNEIIVAMSPHKPIREPLRELQTTIKVNVAPFKIEE